MPEEITSVYSSCTGSTESGVTLQYPQNKPAGLDEHSGAPIDKAAMASEILRWKKSMAWRLLCICGLHAE